MGAISRRERGRLASDEDFLFDLSCQMRCEMPSSLNFQVNNEYYFSTSKP